MLWPFARASIVLVAGFVAGLVAGLLAETSAAVAQQDAQASAQAQALVERLHAPCCREQLLAGHDSETAKALRLEIRAQLAQGESSDAVERALVARYGPSIIAVPKESDPRSGLGVALVVSLSAALLALIVLARRWVRRDSAGAQASAGSVATGSNSSRSLSEDAALDACIDAELRELEG